MPTHAEKAQIIRTLAQLGKHDPSEDRPVHFHDCPKCLYLGSFARDTRHIWDTYYCEQDGIPTYIARWGEDDKYVSGLPFVTNHSILALAFARHMAM